MTSRTMPFIRQGLPSSAPIMMSNRGAGMTMPSNRGGSAMPTPQEQAVVEEAIESSSPTQDDIYLEAVALPESSGIHPAIYALGAGALLLGGLLLFRN